uniref:ATP synthase complex subunit 8 n=1 Tax=Phelsuma guimbeaui TaxID=232314 RepID=A0A0A1H9Q6_9SAUR|nr:ATPase subunit 8 [Phelsuma guimbeaui]
MPQLNPAPWLMTFIMSWTALFMIHNTMMKFYPINLIQHTHIQYQLTTPWTWSWQ